jgi:hypothetical protein
VTEAALSERTVRILTAQLGELAQVLERAAVPRETATRLLESASIATMHAVTLDLLTSERATELWREAADQHPTVRELRPTAERFAA